MSYRLVTCFRVVLSNFCLAHTLHATKIEFAETALSRMRRLACEIREWRHQLNCMELKRLMPPPGVTLTFDLLTPKSNQHIYEPKYVCDQNSVKIPSLVFEIWCSLSFRDAQTNRRTHPNTECIWCRSSGGEGIKVDNGLLTINLICNQSASSTVKP